MRAIKFGIVFAFVATVAASAVGDDKAKAPSGSWMKSGGQLRLEFADKGVLKVSPHSKDELILLVCKYTIDKDGVIKAKVTELEGSAKEKVQASLPVGLEFSFKWEAKDDSATIADLKGNNTESLANHLEG